MIFIDSNQLMISNLFAIHKGGIDSCGMDEIRYSFCRGIYWYHKNYSSRYGKMVLCYDSDRYWRKDFFPYYKATRKKQRSSSGIDWNRIGNIFNSVRDEMQKELPIIQIYARGSEADDQIAVLSKHLSGQENIIISSDKDFQQLHSVKGLRQFSPAHKDFLICENPSEYLIEHVIKGDPSDGIPNVLSEDDTMINPDKKQVIMNKKRMGVILNSKIEDLDEETRKRYERNKTLIDFSMIPDSVKESIVVEFETELNRHESDDFFTELVKYLGDHGIMRIIEEADSFLKEDG